MAVVSVKEQLQQARSGRKLNKDFSVSRTHIRVFLVICDDPADGTAVAVDAAGIPADGDFHASGDGTYVQNVNADPVQNSRLHYLVTVEYGTLELSGGGSQPVDPLSQPADISGTPEEWQENYFRDTDKSDEDYPNGKPVVNSAGETFDAMPQRDASRTVITIKTNEETFDIAAADAIANTVNLAAVTIDGVTFSPGQLKLSPIQFQKVFQPDGSHYYQITKRVKAKKDGWNDKIDDYGYSELSDPDSDGKIEPQKILDKSHMPIQKPWPLDGSGKKMPDPKDDPAIRTFKPYVPDAWAGLRWS